MDVASWKGMREDATFPNALLRQALLAIEEVMGKNGLSIILREARLERFIDHPPPNDLNNEVKAEDYAHLNAALENFAGRAGKGMLKRVGKASFQWGVKEQAALLGLAGVALKLMPQKQRQKFILSNVAKALMDTNPEFLVTVEEKDGHFLFTDYSCSICHTRRADKPVCYLLVGSLEEAIRWATGKEFPVEEVLCKAKGDPYCQFRVGAVE
jgi:predicted hydrocarbon binding protein